MGRYASKFQRMAPDAPKRAVPCSGCETPVAAPRNAVVSKATCVNCMAQGPSRSRRQARNERFGR